MKISPGNENDHPQPGGRHYKDSVQSEQSLMQQSSLALGVTQSQARNIISSENPNATHADHHIKQTPVTQHPADNSTSNATEANVYLGSHGKERVGQEPEDNNIEGQREEHPMPEGRKSMGIENCQDFEEDDAPIPAAQIAAQYESMEKTAKKKKPDIVEEDDEEDDAPIPPSQIASRYESMEKTTKKKPDIVEDEDDSPPLPPWQIGCEDEDLVAKKSYVTSSDPPSIPDCQHSVGAVVVPPSTSHRGNDQNSGQPQVEIVIHRPPPPSMLRSQSDDEEEEPSADLPSLPILEATLVENTSEPPVYDAIAVRSNANQEDGEAQEENADKANIDQHASSWWKRNQKYLLVGLIALVIGAMAATIATLVGSQSDSNIVVPVVETLQPPVSINNDTPSATLPSTTNTTTSTTKPFIPVS